MQPLRHVREGQSWLAAPPQGALALPVEEPLPEQRVQRRDWTYGALRASIVSLRPQPWSGSVGTVNAPHD